MIKLAVDDKAKVRDDKTIRRAIPAPVKLDAAGLSRSLSLRGVAGATGVRVAAASISLVPVLSGLGRSVGLGASGATKVTSITVSSPQPGARIRSLTIPNLVLHDGENDIAMAGESELAGHRLVLAPMVNGAVQAPIVAVPPTPGQNALPAQLTGGSFGGGALRLPDVLGDKFLVTLVTGSTPQDFVAQTISFGDVLVRVAPEPVGLHVEGPSGQELHAVGGPLLSSIEVSVQAALEGHLSGIVADDIATFEGTLSIRSDLQGQASVWLTTNGVVVERRIDERLSVTLEGLADAIDVPAPAPGRAPWRTLADVTIEHHGMALHPLSAAVPAFAAGTQGRVVRDTASVHTLPEAALDGERLRRVGVIGWALDDADLALEVAGERRTVTAKVAGDPPYSIAPIPGLHWFDFDDGFVVGAPLTLRLTATRGAFLWLADPTPRVAFAMASDWQGERVRVANRWVDLTGEETTEMGVTLDTAPPFAVATDQFCTVTLSNALLEFQP